METKATYRVNAELTRSSWRVVVWPSDAQALQPPLWDTGLLPMDELDRTRLVFADVEPPGHTAASPLESYHDLAAHLGVRATSRCFVSGSWNTVARHSQGRLHRQGKRKR